MNVILQKHDAKHIYKVPEGLRELCSDISREVLRSQPANLLAFIAEYVDTLLITRENTKIAVKVVNNILLGSQAILCILYRTGFTLEQIAVAAPRIQKAFREYLDAVDTQPVQICEDPSFDERSMMSIRSILEATGATREDAERAAVVIQAAFRGHYERMALNEAQGKVQWQRAVVNTLDILRKAGATQAEISKAARHVKFAYRGYYTRRNQRIDAPGAEDIPLKKDERILEPAEAIQAVAWMEMMYADSGLTLEKANEAASVIQRAYKRYRARRRCYDVQQLETTKTMVAEAILDKVHHKIFETVTSRADIPTEFGTREEMMATSTKLQVAFKEHLKTSRLIKESHLELAEFDEEEEYEDEEFVPPPAPPKPKYRPRPVETEEETRAEYAKEPLTEEEEMEEPSEAEVTTEQLDTSPELQSEAETESPSEPEFEEETEAVDATKEVDVGEKGEEMQEEEEETKEDDKETEGAKEDEEEEEKKEEAEEKREDQKEEEEKKEGAEEKGQKEEEEGKEELKEGEGSTKEDEKGEQKEEKAEEGGEETKGTEEGPNDAHETGGTADDTAAE